MLIHRSAGTRRQHGRAECHCKGGGGRGCAVETLLVAFSQSIAAVVRMLETSTQSTTAETRILVAVLTRKNNISIYLQFKLPARFLAKAGAGLFNLFRSCLASAMQQDRPAIKVE